MALRSPETTAEKIGKALALAGLVGLPLLIALVVYVNAKKR